MTSAHRWATGAAAVALTLTLAACGADAGSEPTDTVPPPPAATDAAQASAHNDADAQFAQMMVIHHEGAIEMADLAVEKAETAEVRALGERISAAQGPEIDMMTGWLEQWGEEMPHDADMEGMDHGGMDMGGMDQESVMAELEGLSGEDFDRRFLELMIEHHRGAIEMGEAHRSAGESTEAVALAGKVVTDQEAEIAEMERLLEGL